VWTVGDDAPGGMAFDPSGERIALGLQRTTNRGGTVAPEGVDDGLWIVNRSGEGRRQLVAAYPYPFAWSPDGKQIASGTPEFSSDGSERGTKVWIVNVESGRQRTVTTLAPPTVTEGVLDWSPDGKNLLLIIWPTGRSQARSLPKLEQIVVTGGRRAPLLGPAPDDHYRAGSSARVEAGTSAHDNSLQGSTKDCASQPGASMLLGRLLRPGRLVHQGSERAIQQRPIRCAAAGLRRR